MKILNETLKKLTREEALNLDLCDFGCIFVSGDAKKKVRGFKTVLNTEDEMHYLSKDNVRVELVALTSKNDFDGELRQDWCLRLFNVERKEYIRGVQPLLAAGFVR